MAGSFKPKDPYIKTNIEEPETGKGQARCFRYPDQLSRPFSILPANSTSQRAKRNRHDFSRSSVATARIDGPSAGSLNREFEEWNRTIAALPKMAFAPRMTNP
jgi:hypothetical protein